MKGTAERYRTGASNSRQLVRQRGSEQAQLQLHRMSRCRRGGGNDVVGACTAVVAVRAHNLTMHFLLLACPSLK